MLPRDAATEKIERQPTAFVEEIAGCAERVRAPDAPEIVGLDKLCVRAHTANGLHAENSGFGLVEQSAEIAAPRLMMRIPKRIKTAKACSGVRLVHGRVGIHPGITRGNFARIGRKLVRELLIEKAGVLRPTAVMDQADDRADSLLPHGTHAFIRPSPGRVEFVAFPEQAVAQGFDAELCDALDVADTLCMTGDLHLVEVGFADAIAGVLYATPEFERLRYD